MTKVIINNHSLTEIKPHIAFERESMDSEAGAVLLYETELSARYDIKYLLNANKEILESEVEYVESSIYSLF